MHTHHKKEKSDFLNSSVRNSKINTDQPPTTYIHEMILSNFSPVLTTSESKQKSSSKFLNNQDYESSMKWVQSVPNWYYNQYNAIKKDEPQRELCSLEKSGLWIKQG